jgi:REP element-mobilizing transposase RayT
MPSLTPLYTRENCKFSGPLRWGLTVFWCTQVSEAPWLNDLTAALKGDGLRLLGQRFQQPGVSQFSLSTLAVTSPLFLVRRVKGRLQYLVRRTLPKPFQRNYALRSFGPATRTAVEAYVASQLQHHPMSDPRVQAVLERMQINNSEVNLAQPRPTAHARYWYNLHVVLVHQERWAEVSEAALNELKTMIERVSWAKRYLLSHGGVLPDHVHLALGCPIEAAPCDVALAFLNNLAYAQGMRPVYQYGAYVGTFGEYHQGAVRSDKPKLRTDEQGAGE